MRILKITEQALKQIREYVIQMENYAYPNAEVTEKGKCITDMITACIELNDREGYKDDKEG